MKSILQPWQFFAEFHFLSYEKHLAIFFSIFAIFAIFADFFYLGYEKHLAILAIFCRISFSKL